MKKIIALGITTLSLINAVVIPTTGDPPVIEKEPEIIPVVKAAQTEYIPWDVKRDYEDTFIPQEYQNYCEEIGMKYSICPELLMAIIETESAGKPNAQNGPCYGLMQVNINTHRERANRLGVDIKSPYGNIYTATDLLADLYQQYGETYLVLLHYNGVSHADSRYENGETFKYADKVLNRTMELERVHGL